MRTELGLPPSPRFRRLIGPLLGRPLDGLAPARLWDYVADLAASQAGLPRAEPGNEGR